MSVGVGPVGLSGPALKVWVANAALQEVGSRCRAELDSRYESGWSLSVNLPMSAEDEVFQARAIALAVIATKGPTELICCRSCFAEIRAGRLRKSRCTPARDVLRGVCCGGGT